MSFANVDKIKGLDVKEIRQGDKLCWRCLESLDQVCIHVQHLNLFSRFQLLVLNHCLW